MASIEFLDIVVQEADAAARIWDGKSGQSDIETGIHFGETCGSYLREHGLRMIPNDLFV